MGRLSTEELGLTYNFRINGERLRGWREREGLTQRELVRMCGLAQAAICKLERERYRKTNIETARKIVQGTKLAKDYLGLPETPFSEEELSEDVWNRIIGCMLGGAYKSNFSTV